MKVRGISSDTKLEQHFRFRRDLLHGKVADKKEEVAGAQHKEKEASTEHQEANKKEKKAAKEYAEAKTKEKKAENKYNAMVENDAGLKAAEEAEAARIAAEQAAFVTKHMLDHILHLVAEEAAAKLAVAEQLAEEVVTEELKAVAEEEFAEAQKVSLWHPSSCGTHLARTRSV